MFRFLAILAQAILFKPLLLTRRGRFTVELLLFLVFLRPRQSCHGTQETDFHGHPYKVGPRWYEGPRLKSEKWPHAKPVGSGSAQHGPAGRWRFSKRSSRSFFTSTRPRCGAGGSKPTGFQVGSCIARYGRLRWTKDCNIEILLCKKPKLLLGAKRSRIKSWGRRPSFPTPKSVFQFLKRKKFASKSCWTKRCFDKSGCGASCRSNARNCHPQFQTSQRSSKGWKLLSQNSERNETICGKKWGVEVVCGWRTNLQSMDRVPPIPVQEQRIYDWLSSRNCELRNALEFGDHSTISKLFSLLADGCGRLAAFGTTKSMDNQFKIRFDGYIDHGWRCQASLLSCEGCSSFGDWTPSELRESRYGLRGVRVGEGVASRHHTVTPREVVAEHVGG